MKFQILSDIHLEFFNNRHKKTFIESLKTDADYVLVAGDISTGAGMVDDYNLLTDILGPVIETHQNHRASTEISSQYKVTYGNCGLITTKELWKKP